MLSINDPTISEHFDSLPPGLKRAIAGSNWEASMRQIATENKLHIDQGDIIGTEVLLVMIGLADPNQFSQSIQREAKLPEDLANKITEEVDEKIFRFIKNDLLSLYKERGDIAEKEEEIESREDLLAEIEKPGPVTLGLARLPGSPKTPEKTWIPGQARDDKAAMNAVPEDTVPPPPAPPVLPPPPAAPGATPLFVRKLEETVMSGSSVSPAVAPVSTEPKKYSVDPYREQPTA